MNLDPFQEFIRDRTGIFFEKSRLLTLENGITTRMREKNITSAPLYFKHLSSEKEELGKLIMLITINETYFFREKEQISLATEKLVPKILAEKNNKQKVRFFCAGCSTGEEPYSIVMDLKERYGPNPPFQYKVTAVDIDNNALLTAQKGIYGNYSFRSFNFAALSKYLIKEESNRYKIIDAVKREIEFLQFNLNQKEYPAKFFGVDIIFYRNVSIYFRPETQKSIFTRLSKMLNPGGYLIMGATETFAHNFSVISLVEHNNNYVYYNDPARQPC